MQRTKSGFRNAIGDSDYVGNGKKFTVLALEGWGAWTPGGQIAYGDRDRNIIKTLPMGDFQCTNQYFGGDPTPGSAKECYTVTYDGTGAPVVAPPPPPMLPAVLNAPATTAPATDPNAPVAGRTTGFAQAPAETTNTPKGISSMATIGIAFGVLALIVGVVAIAKHKKSK